MAPRRGQAPGYGGRGYPDDDSSYPPGPPRDGGGRGGRGGGPGRGPFPSQDWRSQSGGGGPSGGGGGGPSGGPDQGRGGGYGGRGYAGGRGGFQAERGYGGEGYGAQPRGGFPAEGGRGGQGYGGGQSYEGRGRGGQTYEGRGRGGQTYEGRGQGRGGRGGRRGGRGPSTSRDQQTGGSSSSGLQGSWASPRISELLPGLSDLTFDEAGPSTRTDEEVTSTSELVAASEGDTIAEMVTSSIAEMVTSSRPVLVAPNRPQVGKLGDKSMVRANHFLVTLKPDANIYHYDVDINPKVTSKGVARRLQRQLLADHGEAFQGKLPVYDGSKSLYTAGPLPFQSQEFTVVFANENREKTFKITVRHVATLGNTALKEFLLGRKIAAPQEHLQALDVALREALMNVYTPVSRSFFTKELGSAPLDGGLTAWNGFFQSLRPTAQGLVLNVDLATTAFYESVPVIDFLRKKFRQFNPQQRLNDAFRNMIRKALSRLKIQVTHRNTPRKYRIYGLSPGATKDLKFSLGEGGEEISIVDYFRQTYNYNIRYAELPCLQVQASRTSYLPMEVCQICEGQKYVGKLAEMQTTSLRNLACVKPNIREGNLRSIMARDHGPGRGHHVASFGMSVSPELTLVSARVLRAPKLKYGMQGRVKFIEPGRAGSWNMMNSHLVEGGTVDYWAFISFDRTMGQFAEDFIYHLATRCQELGIQMRPETVVPPYLGRREDLEGRNLEMCLREVCDRAKQEIGQGGNLQLLVCVMGEKHPAYGDLKRLCETQLGVVTQCCLSKNAKKMNSQYLANVALKINAKVGGRNNTLAVELPELCNAFKRPTIIYGADVTHPNPGDDSSPSIAAVVANVDWPSAIKYVASVRSQSHREEMIANLKEMVIELWRKYCDKAKVRPECIIMFRDGVSEGQFDKVLQCEVHALKEAMQAVGGPGYNPLITWVVVQKRHHTRLFPADNNKDKSGNVPPGTVVDTTITHPREYDFYLCSHAGIQGTSKPTHYHVLWDENNFSSDDLQSLTNNLCYTYARCTRSVSVVPPAYYAHLAAYRARLYIEGQGGSETASYTSGQPSSVGSGGRTTRAAAPLVRPLPQIAPNIREVMYFC